MSSRGFQLAKTNPILFTNSGPKLVNPGFVATGLDFGRNLSRETLHQIDQQVAALSDGLAPQANFMLDLNFGFAAEGFGRIAERIRRYKPKWLELDMHEPAALARVRAGAMMPIASLETIYGGKAYNQYLQAGAADIAVVDVLWNGFAEAARIAAIADAYEINVAPHNFYGPLADLIAAHFCTSVPNFDVMEIEADDVPWKYSLLTNPPRIEHGHLHLPAGAGWGSDVDEYALAQHRWKGIPVA
jgi:L-alanine-DL-glutamate epimerase-like enolase superfamily enzyme